MTARVKRPKPRRRVFTQRCDNKSPGWVHGKTAALELNTALSAIPAVFREVIVLRDFEDLSYKEIAAVIDVPIGTVMSRLARARVELRRELLGSNGGAQRGGTRS